MKKQMHAWFSEAAAKMSGSWGMKLISGKEVRITCVGDDYRSNADYYIWPDKVYLGVVDSDTYHDYWRGDEDVIEYMYEYSYKYDPFTGDYEAVAHAVPHVQGSWTNKRHSIESKMNHPPLDELIQKLDLSDFANKFKRKLSEPTTAIKVSKDLLKIGDICPVCGKEYKERPLATSTYIGCWC